MFSTLTYNFPKTAKLKLLLKIEKYLYRVYKENFLRSYFYRTMSRTFLMKRSARLFLAFVVAGFVLTGSVGNAEKPSAAESPNVLFILADDLGWGDLGSYGGTVIPTPNLDHMAANGMRFTNHYAGSTVCAPSRSALMVGQHMGHALLRGNPAQVARDSPLHNLKDRVGRTSDFPVREDKSKRTTLAEVFKRSGYRTGIIGKWGLGNPGTPGAPQNVGFDSFFGLATHIDAHTYHPDKLWANGHYVKNEGKKHLHPQYIEQALQFIEQNRNRDFFLYLPFQFPHAPHNDKDALQEESFTKKHKLQGKVKVYASMVAQLDRSVGRIIQKLHELQIQRETLVIFTSDNGPPNQVVVKEINSNGPLRGRKRDLYEGGVRVPMIAYWPGQIQSGSTSNFVTAFWDLLPTFADLLGQPVPEQTSGGSLLPVLLGNSERSRPDSSPIYFEWSRSDMAAQAVRVGDWKLIRKLHVDPPRLELYNLAEDIGEQKNLVDKHPKTVKKLRSIMEREHEPNPHFPLRKVDK